MKNRFLAATVLFFALFAPLWGLDIGFSGGGGNVAFDSGLTAPLGDETNPQPFAPALFPALRATVSGESGNIFFEGGFDREPILRNRVFAAVGVDLTYFKMSIGPFIGLFNTAGEIFNPGISAAMNVEFPGVVFVNINAASSLGASLETTGSYTQKAGGLSAGFWVPYVICSLNIESRSFEYKMEANLLTEDALVRYFFRADVFTKNIPFTARVDFGYGSLKRSYYSQSVSGTDIVSGALTDEFKYCYLGLEVAYTFSPVLKLFLAGELPVYSWSAPPMKNPNGGSFLFGARGGIVLSLD